MKIYGYSQIKYHHKGRSEIHPSLPPNPLIAPRYYIQKVILMTIFMTLEEILQNKFWG